MGPVSQSKGANPSAKLVTAKEIVLHFVFMQHKENESILDWGSLGWGALFHRGKCRMCLHAARWGKEAGDMGGHKTHNVALDS